MWSPELPWHLGNWLIGYTAFLIKGAFIGTQELSTFRFVDMACSQKRCHLGTRNLFQYKICSLSKNFPGKYTDQQCQRVVNNLYSFMKGSTIKMNN